MKQKIKMGTPLNVLFLDDAPKDAEVCRELIIDSGYNLYMDITATEKEFESFLRTSKYDVILSDFKLPGFDAFGALQLCNEICPDVPFICVSGAMGEETAVELLKLGAVDYILKDRLQRLPFAIERAIDDRKEKESRRKAEILLAASEMQYRRLFESAKDGILILNEETGKIVDVNPFLIELLGYSKEEFLEKEIWEIGFFKNIVTNKDKFIELQQRKYVRYEDLPLETSDGRKINVEFVSNVYPVNSYKVIQCNIRDITERKLAEDKLQESKKKYSSLFNSMNEGVVLHKIVYDKKNKAIDYIIIDSNPAFEIQTGVKSSEAKNQLASIFYGSGSAPYLDIYSQTAATGVPTHFETYFPPLEKYFDISVFSPKKDFFATVFNDITARKRTEKVLSENNKQLDLALRSANMGMWYLDIIENRRHFDDKVCNILGINKATFTGTAEEFFANVHPDDRQSIEAALARTIEKDVLYKVEYRVIWPDGSVHYIIARGSLSRDDEGTPVRINGLIWDITEHKQAEEMLRKSENEFRVLAESMPQIVWITRADGWNIYFNQKWVDYTGLTLEESYGYGWNKPFHPDDQQMAWDAWQNAIKNNAVYSIESRLRSANGTYKWFLVRGVPLIDENGSILKCFGTCTDIHELKMKEVELQKSEEKYKELFEKMLDGVYKSSHEGKFLQINNAMVNMLGYNSKEELYAIDIKSDLYFKESDRESAALEERYEEMAIFRLKKKDGSEIWVEDHGRHVLDDKGNVLYHEGIMRDVTERLRTEQELIAAKEKAEEMNRLKSNFLANMSHELRTPLVGILGFADILSQEVESQESKEMAETILKSGNRLSETLNLILDLSKFETEKLAINYPKFDLVSKAEEIINSFNGTAVKKGLTLKSSFSQDSIIINFDERAFNSILNNLINNALKFTSEGSVTTTIFLNNDFVEIKVIDTGIGINEKDYQIIFDEFRQASEGYNRNFEGSGLGLSITKKIVEKFGGTITVESEIGKGTTFKVKLPVTNAEAKEKEITGAETKIIHQLPKQKSVKPIALLVDDDPFVFTVLKRYASEYIELKTTVDADFAIKKLKEKQYDLIFMDINLRRGMDGKEATKKIRTMKGYESIPIIATTAYAMVGDKEEFLAAGCTHYLSKPFSQEDIVSLLEEVLKLI